MVNAREATRVQTRAGEIVIQPAKATDDPMQIEPVDVIFGGVQARQAVDRNAHLRPLRSMPRGYAGFRSACRRGWCSGASRAYGGPRRIRSRDAACSDCPTPCIREDSTGAYKHAPVA